MAKENRARLVKQIEDTTRSRLLCYVTGDRRGMETRIAGDVLPFLYEHVRGMGSIDRLNLFLYTVGGDALAGWGIVSLLREFSRSLGVIIPFKALSCGTLISLGADEVIMAKGGQLSPVDPSLASPYNPPAPGSGQAGPVSLLPVSVEDVMGYIKLAKEEIGVSGEDGLAKVITVLSEKVHPLALGAVYRSREQIALLARKLMAIHENDSGTIERVVETLTKLLPSHQYLINRQEAKALGIKVKEPEAKSEDLIWGLYREYETWLELTVPYNPEEILGSNTSVSTTLYRAAIESVSKDGNLKTYAFKTERELKRIQTKQPGLPFPLMGVQERNISERWAEL